jgi:hypothetical protein
MVHEVKLVCRFCQYAFWAGLEVDELSGSDRLFEVECPQNRSRFLFRIVESADSPWDNRWVYQATEWRAVAQLQDHQPIARSLRT